ncbi:MAG: hypothetical protein U1F57_11955 [bacterium]
MNKAQSVSPLQATPVNPTAEDIATHPPRLDPSARAPRHRALLYRAHPFFRSSGDLHGALFLSAPPAVVGCQRGSDEKAEGPSGRVFLKTWI